MKISIVYDVAYPFIKGGAERRFYEIGSRLSKRGWQVDWLTFQSWAGNSRIIKNGINYVGLARIPRRVNRAGKRNKAAPLLFLFHIIRHLRILKNYQCIWAGQWPILHLFPIVLFCRVTGIPLVVDWWEVWNKNWLTYSRSVGWIGYLLERLLLHWVANVGTIVTDCNLEINRIQTIVGRKSRLFCIPNGIPVSEIGDVDPNEQPEFDLGYLGRLYGHKRVDRLLESIWHLREHHGIVATAAVIGDGPERARLHEFAKKLELEDQVRFFGRIQESSDCYAILKKCRLCVVSTISGGGGNLTLLEALGCGLPVVAFRCKDGIDPDLIEHGRSGLLVEPVSSKSLAESLAILLQNPKRIAEMKRFVLKRSGLYDWNNISEKYVEVFEKAKATRTSAVSVPLPF